MEAEKIVEPCGITANCVNIVDNRVTQESHYRRKSKTIFMDIRSVNPNSEGVPATHLSEGGGLIQPPPDKCSINGPN